MYSIRVLANEDKRLMDYIPLHLGGVEISESLYRWIQSWWPEEEVSPLTFLTQNNWFETEDREDLFVVTTTC